LKKLNFVQIYKENEKICEITVKLCLPYFIELNEHDGITESKEILLESINQRIAIQGKRKDMHFEIAFYNDIALGIAMFAIDSGTVYGLLESGYGTVMEFYILPQFRRKGFGEEFWYHIEETLIQEGAQSFYITPDAVTGIPFWEKMGFADSGLIDPDNKQPIYTKHTANSTMNRIKTKN